METLRIDKGDKEIEISGPDSTNSFNIDISHASRYEYEYLSITLTKEDIVKMIKFLSEQSINI